MTPTPIPPGPGLDAGARAEPDGPEEPGLPEPIAEPAPPAAPDAARPAADAAAEARHGERERALLAAVLERELALALAGRPLVPGAAEQLLRLWRDEFAVTEDAGRFRVGTPDGRPLAQAVDDWLARPEYAHFCRPGTLGGTAAPGGPRARPAAPESAPRTLGEALLHQWQRHEPHGARTDPAPGLRRPR